MNIHFVTHLSGFPYGTAAANRMRMIAKALIESGCNVKIYTNNVFVDNENKESKGVYENIPFSNLRGNTRLKQTKSIRILLFIKGLIRLFFIILRMKSRKDIVYIHAHGFGIIFNFFVIIFCKISNIKVVQEINEWYHNDLNNKIDKIFAEGFMLKHSHGAVVISDHIKNTISQIDPNFKTIVLPVLGEPFNSELFHTENISERYCFWMGLVNPYIEDVLLIIRSSGIAFKHGIKFTLVICGPYSQQNLIRIQNESLKAGIPTNNIRIMGYIKEQELFKLCINAHFFIIPLWNSERSTSRFPTKTAMFLFSGKPLITCKIGPLGKILTDNENVLFYNAEDKDDLAKKIEMLMKNEELHKSLSLNTYNFAMQNIHYKNYTYKLHHFFEDVVI